MRTVACGERGSALVFVLMIALLLSVAVGGALSTVRLEAQQVKARVEQLRVREALRGALELAVYRHAAATSAAGTERNISIGGFDIDVSARDGRRKLDLNRAPASSFAELGLQLGLSEAASAAIRTVIEKARQHEGGTWSSTGFEGRTALVDAAEILRVPGAAASLVQCISPHVSAFGRAMKFDPSALDGKSTEEFGPTSRGAAGIGGQSGERLELVARVAQNSRGENHASVTSVLMFGGGQGRLFDWVSVRTHAAIEAGRGCSSISN